MKNNTNGQKTNRNKLPKKQSATKRCRGKRDDVCAKCKKGGELVECDTSSQSMHPGCDKQMPANMWQKNTGYQCPYCRREKTNEHTNNSDIEEVPQQPIRTNKQNSTIIETDSKEANNKDRATTHNNTTNNKPSKNRQT